MRKLGVGVVGLGRLGKIYALDLAHRVPNANLVAVADAQSDVASSFARENNVPNWYSDHRDLLADTAVDAVAVVTPTCTHKNVVVDVAEAGKAVFCEKPISLSLADARGMLQIVEQTAVLFQMGFMRRFDRGYLEAKRKIQAGCIGEPLVLNSISRDPFAPPLEFCDPTMSGGLFADMGIHDYDVARMFMGEIKSVYSVGGVLAYPEMESICDVDNATVSAYFESGALGTVQLSRNAVFGYDIRAEIWGTQGTLQVGYFRDTPVLLMTREGVSHDVVPNFIERFESAYLAQIQDFVNNVLENREPPITGADGVAALVVALAATKSFQEQRPVDIAEIRG